jgi:hypothetical protein
MTAPDTALLEKHAGFEESVSKMLHGMEKGLRALQKGASGAVGEARVRGYVV